MDGVSGAAAAAAGAADTAPRSRSVTGPVSTPPAAPPAANAPPRMDSRLQWGELPPPRASALPNGHRRRAADHPARRVTVGPMAFSPGQRTSLMQSKNISASNLAALSIPHLSLTEVRRRRGEVGDIARAFFESQTQRFFVMLTRGCQPHPAACPQRNPLCALARQRPELPQSLLAMMAIQLATSSRRTQCCVDPGDASAALETPLPADVFQAPPDAPQPFLHRVFSAQAFASLFSPRGLSSAPYPGAAPASLDPGRRRTVGPVLVTTSAPPHPSSTASSRSAGSHAGVGSPTPPPPSSSSSSSTTTTSTSSAATVSASSPFPYLPSTNNDTSFSTEPTEVSLTHLTLQTLEQAIETCMGNADDSFLVNTLSTVFASVSALGASFRLDDDTDADAEADADPVAAGGPSHSSSPVSTCPIHFAHVDQAYARIINLGPTFAKALTYGISSLLAEGIYDPSNTSADIATALLIVLEWPQLRVPGSSPLLLESICHYLRTCSPAVNVYLSHWLSSYEPERLARLVDLFKAAVSTSMPPGPASESKLDVFHAIKLLRDANELALLRSGERVLDISAFYHDELARRLVFKREYQQWKQQLEDEEQGRPPTTFSYLSVPFLLTAAAKWRILRIDAVTQMSRMFKDAFLNQAWVFQAQKLLDESMASDMSVAVREATNPYLVLEVRREHLIRDTLRQISLKLHDLKKPLKIKYVGGGEEGLDLGGVQKEFFQSIMQIVFDPDYGMFVEEPSGLLWINAAGLETDEEFELIGILIGLAIYNGIILDLHFPLVLYKKLLGFSGKLKDVDALDAELARGLQQLLDFDGDVEDIFCYSFQITRRLYGENVPVDLVPGGADIPVTNDNREEFVERYVQHLLHDSIRQQFDAFARGFLMVCGGPALKLVLPEELELIICGSPSLDFQALESGASYAGGFTAESAVVRWLWKIVHGLSHDQQKQFLHFVTGSSRVPIQGLGRLCMVVQRNGADSERLPTALTCFSRLLLPEYASEAKLRKLLLLAIENATGFGLA